MALSGSLTTNLYTGNGVSGGRGYKLSWTATQNIANNTSTISWKVETAGGYAYRVAERTLKVTLAGKTLIDKTDRVMRGVGTVSSGTFTVTHNSSTGAATMAASIQAAVYVSSVVCTASTTFTLDTIPRQATLTAAPNFNDEQNPTITYSNPAGNNVDSLAACISWDGTADNIAYRSITKTGTSYTFSFTDAERATLRSYCSDANSKTVYFYVRTIIGDNTFYSRTAKTLSIINANPTASLTVEDTNSTTLALTGDKNKFVRYYSNAKFTITASAKKGASLRHYQVNNSGETKSDLATGTFTNVTSASFTYGASDTRYNSCSYTLDKTLINYIKLTCSISAQANVDGTAVVKVGGDYFNGSFGSQSNSLTLQYRYKQAGGSYGSWTSITPTYTTGRYSGTANLSGLNYQSAYTFQCRAVDKLATVNSAEITSMAKPVFDWGKSDFNFNVPVTINSGGVSYNLFSTAQQVANYPLSGLYRAMSNAYDFNTSEGNLSVYRGSSYSGASANCVLCGNNLRVRFSATRSSNTGTGDIGNEEVMTIVLQPEGKITNCFNTAFTNGQSGGIASFYTSTSFPGDGSMEITITLCATGTAMNSFYTMFTLPVQINPGAY